MTEICQHSQQNICSNIHTYNSQIKQMVQKGFHFRMNKNKQLLAVIALVNCVLCNL